MYRSAGRRPRKERFCCEIFREKEWIYAQHWTLGRLEKDHFVTMNHAGLVFEKETLELLLPVGIYRLIAVKRLLNGDQEAAELLFAIEKEKQTELYMPDFEKTDGVMPLEKNSVPDESQSCRSCKTKTTVSGRKYKAACFGTSSYREQMERVAVWKSW